MMVDSIWKNILGCINWLIQYKNYLKLRAAITAITSSERNNVFISASLKNISLEKINLEKILVFEVSKDKWMLFSIVN